MVMTCLFIRWLRGAGRDLEEIKREIEEEGRKERVISRCLLSHPRASRVNYINNFAKSKKYEQAFSLEWPISAFVNTVVCYFLTFRGCTWSSNATRASLDWDSHAPLSVSCIHAKFHVVRLVSVTNGIFFAAPYLGVLRCSQNMNSTQNASRCG